MVKATHSLGQMGVCLSHLKLTDKFCNKFIFKCAHNFGLRLRRGVIDI